MIAVIIVPGLVLKIDGATVLCVTLEAVRLFGISIPINEVDWHAIAPAPNTLLFLIVQTSPKSRVTGGGNI